MLYIAIDFHSKYVTGHNKMKWDENNWKIKDKNTTQKLKKYIIYG